MNLVTLMQFSGLVFFSFAIATLVLFTLGKLERNNVEKTGLFESPDGGIAFLFDDEVLVNATPRARNMLCPGDYEMSDWERLTASLLPHFPNLKSEIAKLAEKGYVNLVAEKGDARLNGQWKNGLARISLVDFSNPEQDVKLESSSYEAIQQELETLRSAAATAPVLVWRQTRSGAISWANTSYLNLAKARTPDAQIATWPPRRLFEFSNSVPAPTKITSTRVSTTISGEVDQRWFECFETPLGDDSLFTAVPADKVVRAETALTEFVQTLTKTFAHLKIGLAIFDKQRRLALFNPALVELTSLKPEFLSGRPMLQAVLDQLRENQVLPEPKDYKSWRRRIYELEVAAVNGTYEETWSLPNGRTYRVTGQPHPDGALAFLMEDISAEISLTRRFRAELGVGQAVLDAMPEAIAVFSSTGSLTISNAAYRRLWEIESNNIIDGTDILTATRNWARLCVPTPVWGDAREFCGSLEDRSSWNADVRLLDGRNLECRFTPISGGATLAGFTIPVSIEATDTGTETELGSEPASA